LWAKNVVRIKKNSLNFLQVFKNNSITSKFNSNSIQ